jgi:hypothetical protein
MTTRQRPRRKATPAPMFIGRPRDARGRRIRTAAPSARELFTELRARLLASRPIIGHTPVRTHAPKVPNGKPTTTGGGPIYGKPQFENRIDENGAHL